MLAKEIFKEPSEIELVDGNNVDEDNMFYGGISYIGECLDNFLGEIELDFNKISVFQLLQAMNECNVTFKDIQEAINWNNLMQQCCNKYEYLMSAQLKEQLNEELKIYFEDFDY